MLPTRPQVEESRHPDRPGAALRAGTPVGNTPLRSELLASVPPATRRSLEAGPIQVKESNRRVLFYTRFSTAGQSELSTERQVGDCRKYSDLANLTLAEDGVYSDEARSGFYIAGRERLHALLERVRHENIFAIVIADPSRLARDMVDLAQLHRQLRRRGIELHSAASGKLDSAMIAMYGCFSQQQIEALVHNTRYARRAMVRRGLVPWGARTFGYMKASHVGGDIKPNPAEEVIVKDIFKMAKARVAHAQIAKILNDEQRFGRRKRPWTADAIGSTLKNVLYRGIIVYCRYRHQRDPDDLKVRLSPVCEDDWEIEFADHLEIIDGALWEEVRALARPARKNVGVRKGPYLLSELVVCPSCKEHMVCMGAPAQGQERRFVCSSRIYNRSCPNQRSWDMRWIEAGTLGLLANELEDASLYEPYLATMNAQSERLAADVAKRRAELEARLDDIKEQIKATLDPAYGKNVDADIVEERRGELRAERNAVKEALARTGRPRAAIDVAARVAELGDLGATLRDLVGDECFDTRSREGRMLANAIRGLIECVVPTPDPASRGVAIELSLAEMGFYDVGAAGQEPARVVRGVYVPPTKEHQRRQTALAKIEPYLATGQWRLDDATWGTVRHLVPENAFRRLDGERRDGRSLIEAMLLGLRVARPFADLPPEYGSSAALRRATRILVNSEGWAKVVSLLHEQGSKLVEGVDASRYDYFLKPAARARRLAGGAPSRVRRGQIAALLSRPDGATLAEVQAMTGLRSGAIRTAVSRLPRLGLRVTRFRRPSGARAWRAAAVDA